MAKENSRKVYGFQVSPSSEVPPPSNQLAPQAPGLSTHYGKEFSIISRDKSFKTKSKQSGPMTHRKSLLTTMLSTPVGKSAPVNRTALNPSAAVFKPGAMEEVPWSEDEDESEISDSQGSTLSSFSQPIPIRRPSRPCSFR
jgi:hypothetical protein